MQYIHTDVVIEEIEREPSLIDDRYILLTLKMKALDRYVGNHSPVLDIILAYTILKHRDQHIPLSLHLGIYESPTTEVPYLQIRPSDEDQYFILDIPVNQTTIISELIESDLITGKLLTNEDTICVGSDMMKYDPFYRNRDNTVPLPDTKGSLMKTLRREGIIDDTNVRDVSLFIDEVLIPDTNFIQMIKEYPLFRGIHDLMIRTIAKIKIVKGINTIFDHYAPDRCTISESI